MPVCLLAVVVLIGVTQRDDTPHEDFLRLMNVGKAWLDADNSAGAIDVFSEALTILPTNADAQTNLAIALLRADRPEEAVDAARRTIEVDRTSAAAYYVMGCAHSRLRNFESATKAIQMSLALDPGVSTAHFQLGVAYRGSNRLEAAERAWRDTITLQPNHFAAHYTLSQLLFQLDRVGEAEDHARRHQEILALLKRPPTGLAAFERCRYTQARVPDAVDHPDNTGIAVTFHDITSDLLADGEPPLTAIAPVDLDGDGRVDLITVDTQSRLRIMRNDGDRFVAAEDTLVLDPASSYHKCLTADLDNDRKIDVLVVGEDGLRLVQFDEHGALVDRTQESGLAGVQADDAILLDLDHTGKLDVLIARGDRLRLFRNTGGLTFRETTERSGLGAQMPGLGDLVAVDWDGDELIDVLVAREHNPAVFLQNQFLGALGQVEPPEPWPSGRALAVDDVSNDLRPDLLIASSDGIKCVLGADAGTFTVAKSSRTVRRILLVDYDNDGWLDVCVAGQGLRVYRNLGFQRFRDVTESLGFDGLDNELINDVGAADIDGDGDTDLLVLTENGLRVMRNDGGNANGQLKLRLTGTRSNTSGIGVKIEIRAGRFRTTRTVSRLPVEIGVGSRDRLDTLTVVWADQIIQAETNVPIIPGETLTLVEPLVSSASCPFLYAWDGKRFRFVSDFLGTSPLGLRATDDRFVDADVDEYVWIGDQSLVRPRDGWIVLQLANELREVLYLDEAKLVAVDHPAGTEVHSTDKLGVKPFQPSEILTLCRRVPLVRATAGDGGDVTDDLLEIDGRYFSPPKLQKPQLRGLAERFGVTVDFGELATNRPLVLALTGWLMWGGATSNVASSHHADLPFPFPVLEYEDKAGAWKKVDVFVGAPAGRTKTIMVDLDGRLQSGARRLRLTTAFEIHWDRVAMFERDDSRRTSMLAFEPDVADLHWRGVARQRERTTDQPIRPIYDQLLSVAKWPRVPSGWYTRYGSVRDLVTRRDNALVLLACGDELTLSVAASRLPVVPDGQLRDFFLFSVGWDKDADYHVQDGWTVEPLPFHGMDDQRYGQEDRPDLDDRWIDRYNTRWVGP